MPIEVRLEFDYGVIDRVHLNPGESVAKPHYDALQNRVHLAYCEKDDKGGMIRIANIEFDDMDEEKAVVKEIKEEIILGVGERYIDFIDVSGRVINIGEGPHINIGQLVIEHKPALL